jgi:hypothetical protein
MRAMPQSSYTGGFDIRRLSLRHQPPRGERLLLQRRNPRAGMSRFQQQRPSAGSR